MKNAKLIPVLLLVVLLPLVSIFSSCVRKLPAPLYPTPVLQTEEKLVPISAEKIVIGGPISISGRLAKEGEQCLWGILAGVKWVNEVYGGAKVGGLRMMLDYKYYDDESKKELVTSLIARAITEDKVKAVVSPYSSGLVLPGAAVAEKYGIVYLNQGGASDRIHQQGYQYAVQTYVPGTRYHVGVLDMFHKMDAGAKKLALAYEDEEFSLTVRDGAQKYAAQLGYEIVFNRTYPSNVTDLTPILSDLKGAKPDLILGGGHFADTQLFAKQMADLSIDVKGVSLVVGPTLPAYYEALGPLAEGIMGPAHWEYGVKFSPEAAKTARMDWIGPTQDEYVSLFKSISNGVEPDYHAAGSTAILFAFVKAAEQSGSLDSDKIREALGKAHFMSVYGEWAVDGTGLQTGHASVDVQWQNGKKVIIWPPPAATGKVVYPRNFPPR